MPERDAYEVLQVNPRAHEVVIRAAYRALAALYHPDRDGSQASQRLMAELNAAFALVRTNERREVYDRLHQPVVSRPSQQTAAPKAPAPKRAANTLDFGRYEGWTIEQLAHEDPDYLKWLSRHSSGIRYRQQIAAALEKRTTQPTTHERVRGRRNSKGF
jgi:curved DNA-binding protein CbpA